VKANRAQQRAEEPEAEFPPLALQPPSLTAVPPIDDSDPAPAARRHNARTEYLDSELYQPLSSLLLGGRKLRIALMALLFIAYNAGMAVIAFDAVGSSPSSDDRVRVVAVVFGGLLLGLIVALTEYRYRLRRRFTFKG
jgi:hypothetical protein